jgi:peptidylprolyl isomerase
MSKSFIPFAILLLAVFFAASAPLYAKDKVILSATGLKYQDLKVGKGEKAAQGKTISMLYTGWFDINGTKGEKFDSSIDKGGKPLTFILGVGRAIKGLDEGIIGMRVGGKRLIMIPPELAYGEKGMSENRKQIIPPNSPVMFEIELVEMKSS